MEALDQLTQETAFRYTVMVVMLLAYIVWKAMPYLQPDPCPHCNGRGHKIIDDHVVNCQCRDEDEIYGITIDEIIELTEDDEDT